jgi:hypothetical protein
MARKCLKEWAIGQLNCILGSGRLLKSVDMSALYLFGWMHRGGDVIEPGLKGSEKIAPRFVHAYCIEESDS